MGELAPPLRIRAHHLLCILGFRGLGYSPQFVAVMGKVVKELSSDATLPIIVIAECDVICASCPHNRENECREKADSEQKVKAKDLAVLQRLGFETGTEMPAGKARQKIKESLSAKDIMEICPDCEWLGLGYCVEGLARLTTG